MTEETAIRIAEAVESGAGAAEVIGVFTFFAICIAIVIWTFNR